MITKITRIDVFDEAGNPKTITVTNIGWMLGVGWMFYLCSLFLNLVYYIMHPSSPGMWTCGVVEELEGWTPPEETKTQDVGGELQSSISESDFQV